MKRVIGHLKYGNGNKRKIFCTNPGGSRLENKAFAFYLGDSAFVEFFIDPWC